MGPLLPASLVSLLLAKLIPWRNRRPLLHLNPFSSLLLDETNHAYCASWLSHHLVSATIISFFGWPTTVLPATSYSDLSSHQSAKEVKAVAAVLQREDLPAGNNTGTDYLKVTKDVYQTYGLQVAGAQAERRSACYMKGGVCGSGSMGKPPGLTVVLVETSEVPRPSPSARPKFDDGDDEDDDLLTGLTSGKMADIIMGVLVGVVALVAFCCWRECCCCGKEGDDEKKRRELMREWGWADAAHVCWLP